jgi:hypothetical protein
MLTTQGGNVKEESCGARQGPVDSCEHGNEDAGLRTAVKTQFVD